MACIWAKIISVLVFSMITSWMAPPMVEIVSFQVSGGATLSRKLSLTYSVCAHASPVSLNFHPSQPLPHHNENVSHYFSGWETSHMSFIPGCSPTKYSLNEEWMNELIRNGFLCDHPSSVPHTDQEQDFPLYFWCSHYSSSFLFWQICSKFIHPPYPVSSLLSLLYPKQHSFALSFLTLDTSLVGWVLWLHLWRDTQNCVHFPSVCSLARKQAALCVVPQLK